MELLVVGNENQLDITALNMFDSLWHQCIRYSMHTYCCQHWVCAKLHITWFYLIFKIWDINPSHSCYLTKFFFCFLLRLVPPTLVFLTTTMSTLCLFVAPLNHYNLRMNLPTQLDNLYDILYYIPVRELLQLSMSYTCFTCCS